MRSSSVSFTAICMCAFVFAALLMIASTQPLQNKGPHGGTIKKADNYFIELKAVDKFFYVYLLDPKLKTIPNKGVFGEVKFFLPDSTIYNVQLKPFENSAFTGTSISDYSSCRISFRISSISISAMFSNQRLIARE